MNSSLSLFLGIALALLPVGIALKSARKLQGRELRHLAIIKKSIRAIHRNFSIDRLSQFRASLSLAVSEKEFSEADPVIAVNQIASDIIRHFKLPDCLVIVRFSKQLPVAGRVELTPQNEYFVELNNKYRYSLVDIVGILVHEIAHIFLYRHQLVFSNELENEILTDTASAYLGAGWLSLNAHQVVTTNQYHLTSVTQTRREKRLGYLSPQEFGYVLAKRSVFFQEKSGQFLTSSAAKFSFRKGQQVADREKRLSILSSDSLAVRGLYRWRRLLQEKGWTKRETYTHYRFESYQGTLNVIVDCPVCSQKLRYPTRKKANATCGTCCTTLICRT